MRKKTGMHALDNDQLFNDWTEKLEQVLPSFWNEFNQLN